MGEAYITRRGGSNPLNFKVVGGTSAPSNPKENTIWVNTDQKITSWHFGADEPNVYDVQTESNYPWKLYAPHHLRDGDILNFTIPGDPNDQFEAIRLQDSAGKEYYVRQGSGSAVAAWPAGTKVGVRISNDLHPIKGWVGHGTAYLYAWDKYYHEEGTAWMTTGISSTTAFDALKKNGIQVYPISAKQYVNGAWVDKTAKSYIGGKWVDWWNGELYKDGNEYITFTGGWESRKSTEAAGTVKKNASNFVVSTSDYQLIYCKTVDTVDLTKYSKVTFKVTDISASVHNEITLGVYPENFDFRWTDTTAQLKLTYETGKHSIDVSALSGKYYVAVRAASNSGVSTTVTVSEVFLE